MDHQAWLEGAKQRFRFERWPRRLRDAALPRARQFALSPEAVAEGWVFERRVAHGPNLYTDYFEELGRPAHRVMIRIAEFGSHEAALFALLELLSRSMAITLPQLDAHEGEVGDVAFRGHDPLTTTLFFVRHNILIDARSIGSEPVSVLSLAARVDAQIQAAAA